MNIGPKLTSKERASLEGKIARGLSLLLVGFLLSLFILNEDFRHSPTLPTYVLWIIALSLLIAWRWERTGAIMILSTTLVFIVSLLLQWLGMSGFGLSIIELALIGICMAIPFLAAGSLFLMLALRGGEESRDSTGKSAAEAD